MHLGIIGGGRAAWAFGSTWRRTGWPISGIAKREGSPTRVPELLAAPAMTRDEVAASCDVLLLAVSDRAIEEVAASLPATRAVVFHASGALPHVRGGFSLHPLRVLPPVGEPADLGGALLVFEGNRADVARSIADRFGARFAAIDPAKKAAYHAGAVFGANYVAALLEIAEELMNASGVANARGDLAALAESAIRNWLEHGDARRFTGPAARGDDEVVARHLQALAADPRTAQIYELLADVIRAAILDRRE